VHAATLKAHARNIHLRMPRPLFRMGARLAPVVVGGDENLRRIYREQLLIDDAFSGGRLGGRETAGASERVIEIPWALRHAMVRSGRLLDVGTAHAIDVYRRLLVRLPYGELHLLDLAPVEIPGAVSHQADVRATPFADDHFDRVICISTLEHIGLDVSEYVPSEQAAEDGAGDVAALRELARVTRSGGEILLTVPGGEPGSFGWYRQYDEPSFTELVHRAGASIAEVEYFVHDAANGWSPAPGAELEGRRWGETATFAGGLVCASLRPA
jgi:SAM-dependent methyltransferase